MNFDIIIIGLVAIIVINLIRYRPWLDVTREGDVVLWYNKKGKRVWKHLFKIFP